MKYVVSDLHGEFDLFMQLINKIKFSSQDEMFICGDVIDKGPASIKLAKYISQAPNIHCIVGNHEHAFLKYYHSLLQESDVDYDIVLSKLQNYFPGGDDYLDWEVMDWLETLPYYIEEPEFICVHAGILVTNDHTLVPLQSISEEEFVFNRRFKDPSVYHTGKCVFSAILKLIVCVAKARSLATREITTTLQKQFRIISRYILIPEHGAMAFWDVCV